jgi:hypothetical protein
MGERRTAASTAATANHLRRFFIEVLLSAAKGTELHFNVDA